MKLGFFCGVDKKMGDRYNITDKEWEGRVLMKLLGEIALIFGVYWLAEGLEQLLPLPMPAGVLSLLLLLALLLLRWVREEHIRVFSDFLLENLSFFFVPAAVGILRYLDTLKAHAGAFLVICILSTVLTFAVTAWTVRLTQKLMERGEKR